ncbi:MAG: SPOR domain-containing protein [Bacteroidota bacterium]
MKWIACLSAIFLFFGTADAQISVTEDPGIQSLVTKHAEANKAKQFINGWRVQLVATSDRNKVMEMKTQFLKRYPRISIDWNYSAPYYRLKAGAFLTKLEAANLKYRIRFDYPDAYITKDNVRPSDL